MSKNDRKSVRSVCISFSKDENGIIDEFKRLNPYITFAKFCRFAIVKAIAKELKKHDS